MNLKRDILKSLLLGGALGSCAVGFAIVRAPSWLTIATSIVAIAMTAVNIILSVMLWRRDRLAPKLSFFEFGFLYEAWKAAKAGRPEVYADTSSQRRLVELGLIEVVRVRRPSPVGLPSPMGDVTLTFSKITPLGRKVLVESVRKEEGEEAANAMEAWQPPGSAASEEK